MGLFKAIGKIGKGIFKGIKKVFKGVTKFVGKIVGSKWGKILLGAAAIFTGGMALAAGIKGAITTPGGFLTKFVAGGKEFLGGLVNPMGKAREMFGGAAQGMSAGQQAAVGSMTEQSGAAAAQLGQGAAQGADDILLGAAGGPGGAAVPTAAPAVAAPGGGGGGGFWDFMKSQGGGQIVSGMIGGYAQGKQQEELLKEQERVRRYYDKQWQDPAQLAKLEQAVSGASNIAVPRGYLDHARQQVEQSTGSTERPFQHRVTFQPQGA